MPHSASVPNYQSSIVDFSSRKCAAARERRSSFLSGAGDAGAWEGLGLSIVQRILDLHRGTIQLDSPATTIG
jgi:hypothetical protein